MLGYFPTYTLGNLNAAQLMRRATQENGSLESELARGEYGNLLKWLREKSSSPRLAPPPAAVDATGDGRDDADRPSPGLPAEEIYRHMNQTLRHFVVIAVVCAVVSRAEAGGVTLITHGFNSDVASWIIPMQGRVAHYGDLTPANTTCYEITITQNGSGQYVAAANLLSGTNPVFAASGEILIKLNWSTLSGLGGASTTVIATTAANALLDTNLIPALGGRTLVEGPLHLVGHSRGALR